MSAAEAHVEVGLVAKAYTMLPLFVAKRRGFFAQEGIDCNYEVFGASDPVTAALESGAIQFSPTTPEGTLLDRANGGRLIVVAGWTNKLPFKLIGLPAHTSLQSLRGGTIGVSSMTEGTVHVIQEIMARAGLSYPQDYALEVVGAHPQRWELLQAGTIDAGLQPTPFDHMAIDAGFSVLADPAEVFPDFAFSVVAADAAWAAEHEALMVGILRALLHATRWAHDDRAGAAEVLVEEAGATPRHAELAVSDLFAAGTLPTDLRVSPAGLDAVITAMRHTVGFPDGVPTDPAWFLDDRYLDMASATA